MLDKKVIIIGKRSNLSINLKKHIENSVVIKSHDIKKLELLLANNNEICIVYNSCIKSSELRLIKDPAIYINYSISYLSEFIKCCMKYINNISTILFTSSSAIYGFNSLAKEDDPYNINSLYASLKISSELLMEQYLADLNVNIVITRIFNMYGGNDQFSVISSIINSIKNDKKFILNNKGESIRDFIHIVDVCKIYKKILDSNFKGKLNICSGSGVSINNLIYSAEKILDKKLTIIDSKRNEIKISIGSTEKLKKIFGNFEYIPLEKYFLLGKY